MNSIIHDYVLILLLVFNRIGQFEFHNKKRLSSNITVVLRRTWTKFGCLLQKDYVRVDPGM